MTYAEIRKVAGVAIDVSALILVMCACALEAFTLVVVLCTGMPSVVIVATVVLAGGILALAVAGTVIVFANCRKTSRASRCLTAVAVALVLYILSYLPLSMLGSYENTYAVAGVSCVAGIHEEVWQPVIIRRGDFVDHWGRTGVIGNGWGSFYAPLFAVDSMVWHRPVEWSR